MLDRLAHFGLFAALLSQVIMVLQIGAVIGLCKSESGGMAHAELLAICDTDPASAHDPQRPSTPPAGESIDALPGTCEHSAMDPSSRRRGDLQPASAVLPPLRCGFTSTRMKPPAKGVGAGHACDGSVGPRAARPCVLLV